MRGCLAALSMLLVFAPTPARAETPIGEEQAKRAALEFGRALVQGEVSALRSVLPARGKIDVRLVHLGPEHGAYSSGQLQAVLKDFLRQGAFRTFDLLRLDCASEQYALVQARAKLANREGRPVSIDLHMTFQPESGHWVLRELRETPP